MSVQVPEVDTLTEWGESPSSEPQPWSLLLRCWAASLVIAFLLGVVFWHTWGPRLRQLAEMMGGLSWSLGSGTLGAGRVTFNMVREGLRNLLDLDRTYGREAVMNPHYVEVDRMPRFPPLMEDLGEEVTVFSEAPSPTMAVVETLVHLGQGQAEQILDYLWQCQARKGQEQEACSLGRKGKAVCWNGWSRARRSRSKRKCERKDGGSNEVGREHNMEEKSERGTRGRFLLGQHVSLQEFEKKEGGGSSKGVCWTR